MDCLLYSYSALFSSIKASIGVQTYAKDLFEAVAFKLDETGLSLDFSNVLNQIQDISDLENAAIAFAHLSVNGSRGQCGEGRK